MKKKTIIFFVAALLFFLSAFSDFSEPAILARIICLAICGAFVFCAFRSIRPNTKTNNKLPQTPNYYASPNPSPISFPSQDNITNTDEPEATIATPTCDISVPFSAESVSAAPSALPEEDKTANVHPAPISNIPDTSEQFEYMEIKVAGVTFKNDKGVTRQTLLKKIKEHSAPFDKYLEISLNQYDFEGELAYSVCVNDRQIGNVPKSQVQYLYDNIERFVAITGINVYGGYRDENGYFKSYGAAITVKFRLPDNS